MRVLRGVLLCIALVASSLPAYASRPIFNGDVYNYKDSICDLIRDFHAAGDDTTDDTTALLNAIAATQAGTCGTIVLDKGKTFRINGAIQPTCTGTSSTPWMQPFRITSDGATWDPYGQGGATNGTGALDLRYDGTDGLHPAKLDLRCGGLVEIDHITLEDKGTDDFIFSQQTNTAVYAHDNHIIGDPTKTGINAAQDVWRLGGTGYWAGSVSTTNGSTTLTIGGGDPPFNSGMVGWHISYSVAGNLDAGINTNAYSATIASYVSPTQVTLSAAATQTISGGEANYYIIGSDAKAPFQGYNSRFVHNEYSNIRRAFLYENFANGIVSEDEMFNYTDGCSLANCAPYYFERSTSPRIGDVIRAPEIEIAHYPFGIFVQANANGDNFEDLAMGDATATNVGGVYFANASAQNNRVSMGTWGIYSNNPSINTTVATGFSSGAQTVTPASMTGISTSTPLLIDPDGSGVQEWVTPSSTTGSTFTATFAFTHGNNIRVLGSTPYFAGAGLFNNSLHSNGLNIEGAVFPFPTTLGGNGATNSVSKTTVTGPLVLPNSGVATGGYNLSQISDGGSVSKTLGAAAVMAFGSIGSLPATNPLCYGSTATGSAYSCLTAASSGVNGIPGNQLALSNSSTGLTFSFDTTGNFSAKNFIEATSGFVSWATGQSLILGNGGAGTNSYIRMSNASGAANQYSFVGNGTSQFGATCASVAPTVFAVAGQGGTCSLATDQNGNVGIGGILHAAGHNACSSTSGVPCEATITCSISAGTTCNTTTTVPATSICSASGNASDTTTGTESWYVSLSTNTLTVTARVSASQTTTAAANVTCL